MLCCSEKFFDTPVPLMDRFIGFLPFLFYFSAAKTFDKKASGGRSEAFLP